MARPLRCPRIPIMTPTPSTARPPAGRLLATILTAWLIAGTLDIGIAVTYYPLTGRGNPFTILQGIASGLLGPRAFLGGVGTAALGLACHYAIALIWTVVFFVVYPRVGVLWYSRTLTAVLYGVFVSLAMNLVVVPMSHVAHRPFDLRFFVIATVILIASIGFPLAIMGSRRLDRRNVRRAHGAESGAKRG